MEPNIDSLPILGLTGGMGCGKSEVCKVLSQMGCSVIEADQLARESLGSEWGVLEKIVKSFGTGILNEYGELNRKKLAAIVFADEDKLKILNQAIQPVIKTLFNSRLENLRRNREKGLVIFDAPLLLEQNYDPMVDKILVVFSRKNIVINRLQTYRGFTLEEIENRMKFQLEIEEKITRADYLIENNGTLETLRKKTRQFASRLLQDLNLSQDTLNFRS